MMETIVAIGGEEVGVLRKNGTSRPILTKAAHQEILFRTGKHNPKVLYIPTAKDDLEEYIIGFQRFYEGLGCSEVDVLRLIRERPSREEIESKILSADAIYVNGGDTFRMMEIWKRHGVDKLLKKAYRKGIVMSGHSAGAICWFAEGDSDSFGTNRDFRVTALGIENGLLCPHYDTDWFRRRSLKKIMKRTPHLVAIALDECASIEIIDNQYRILSPSVKCKARRTYWLKGKYFVEEILPTEEFQSLKVLLTKPGQ